MQDEVCKIRDVGRWICLASESKEDTQYYVRLIVMFVCYMENRRYL